jgi:general secretion pathway protein D
MTSRSSGRAAHWAWIAVLLLLGACMSNGRAPARSPVQQAGQAAPLPASEPEGEFSVPKRTPVIVRGSGKIVADPPSTAATSAPAEGDGYQLSFVDTEIAAVVASVLGDGLGLPYAIDPQIKGLMTLQASRALSREEVLPALESALELQGVAIVNVNGTYQVVPTKDAPRRIGGIRGPTDRRAPGYSVQVVPVRFVSVLDLEKVLRPIAPDGGILRVDEVRNLLLLAGNSRELGLMLDVVQTFDVNWLEGMSFGLYPVEYVDVSTLIGELTSIFADAKSPIANVVRFVPLPRLSSLMVVTAEPSYLPQVEAWIKQLDIGMATPSRRIYVYEVQNGKADDLAQSLNSILSLGGSGLAESALEGPGPGSVNLPARSLGSPTSTVNQAVRERLSGALPAEQGAGNGGLKIVPNVENNSLLVFASPSEFKLIEAAIKRLDVLPLQVLIEASLAEVSLTDDLRFGLQFAYQTGDGPVVLSDGNSGVVSPQFPGFSYLYTARQDIRAVLNAIESLTDVNVLSSPKLLVLNNREAELQIGDQVPITVQSAVSTGDNAAPIVNAVQLRDTGVILRITPRANRSGLVLLDIAQEVSDVVPTTTSNIDSPTIQQRKLSSTIAVRDGETIALGGLIRESKSRTRSGIPYLRRIPLLGNLFGSTSKNSRRNELIVLITPRVLRSSQETEAMMKDLREQFRGLRKRLPVIKDPAPQEEVKAKPQAQRQSIPVSTPSDDDDAAAVPPG